LEEVFLFYFFILKAKNRLLKDEKVRDAHKSEGLVMDQNATITEQYIVF